jgi:Lrp/AsnC family transcriptional regulator, leucine-responsive regulatory protein
MLVKIDEKDRKILLALYKNSRQGTTAVAKQVGLSRENVDYRIRRMEKESLIREYNTYFDESALELKRFVFFIQFVNLKGNIEEDIMNFLRNHSATTWIGPIAGKWSVIFDVVVKREQKITDAMNGFFSKYEKNIAGYISYAVEEEQVFLSKILSIDYVEKFHVGNKKKKLILDSIDWNILKFLNDDSRVSYAFLSLKLKLTANAIKRRIKTLDNAGIIQGYSIGIDFRRLGYEWFTLNLNLASFGLDFEQRLKSFFRIHPKVIFYCRNNGMWEYDVGVCAKNSQELRSFINELRSKFPEEVKIADVFITLEEVKGYKLPRGVFVK